MTDHQIAVIKQALEAMNCSAPTGKITLTAWYKAVSDLDTLLAQQADPVAHSGWVLREVLFDNGEPIGHREPQHSPAALAQQAKPQGCEHCNHPLYAATKCRVCGRVTEQAEPVEPVARAVVKSITPGRIDDLHVLRPLPRGEHLLYTAPPQRKPLTDEEIDAMWRKASECAGKSEGAVTTSQFVQMFARAVERKVRENRFNEMNQFKRSN